MDGIYLQQPNKYAGLGQFLQNFLGGIIQQQQQQQYQQDLQDLARWANSGYQGNPPPMRTTQGNMTLQSNILNPLQQAQKEYYQARAESESQTPTSETTLITYYDPSGNKKKVRVPKTRENEVYQLLEQKGMSLESPKESSITSASSLENLSQWIASWLKDMRKTESLPDQKRGFGQRYAQRDLLKMYLKRRQQDGYNSMRAADQQRYDQMWDNLMAEHDAYQWNPDDPEVQKYRKNGTGSMTTPKVSDPLGLGL